MIKSGEIQSIAAKFKVRDRQIEKDYVISWILYGISQNEFLFKNLAFKGGTVLKKAYFPEYRFSEDLDFSLIEETVIVDDIWREFELIFEWIYEESRIQLSLKNQHKHVTGSINFYISYVGPLGGTKDVKVDITKGERFSYALEERTIFRDYSDLEEVYSLNCYSLSEIVVEKMVAGRTIARDLYDLWYLFYHENLDIVDYMFGFKEKAIHKGHEPSMFTKKVSGKSNSLKSQWVKSLSRQVHELPDFDDVWREFNKHLRKFNNNYE